MANLFDTIKQNRDQLAGQKAQLTDQTGTVQRLLRAKSGTAGSSSEGAVSNLGEASAVADTNAQLASLTPSAAIQDQQLKLAASGQQQQAAQQEQAISQANRFNTVQNNLKTQQLLNDLSRDRGSIDLEKDRAKLEQTAFLLSMQDKQYTDQLQAVGRQRQLNNDLAFRNEMADIAFGENLALLKDKLGKQDILSANDREFNKAMSELSIEDAIRIADLEAKYATQSSHYSVESSRQAASDRANAASEQAKWGGIGEVASTGIAAYGQYASTNKDSSGGGTK